MRSGVGIKDVAHEASVSIATVSHVVSALERVAEGTRARVFAAVDRLVPQGGAA